MIRMQLQQRGLSQEEIAERLGVSDRTVRNWLSRKSAILPQSLELLLAHVGVGVQDVFGEDLPEEYRAKSKLGLGQLVANITELVKNGEVKNMVAMYKSSVEAMARHVSFHKIPPKGPFVMIEHDGRVKNKYARVTVKTQEYRDNARFILSFQYFKLVRVDIGEIVITPTSVTARPFFQKYPHEVARNPQDDGAIDFAFWFGEEGCLFFVESTDGEAFGACLRDLLDERQAMAREYPPAMFWRGVWH